MAKPWIKYALLIGTAFATFVFFFTKPAMPQELSYHLFVDQRMFWNIPNTLDVLSNLAFLIVGILGLRESCKINSPVKNSWIAFFVSILLVAPGSAFYHWAPNNYTLIWDRLPMSTGFMALYVIMLAEHISFKFTKLLPWALLMGLVSVLVWVATDDLRFYFWVQFSSFLTVPIILLAFTSRYTHKGWFGVTLLFYGLAKWTEVKDKEVFIWTHELMSGHTLKHILAAIGLMGVWWMLKVRSEAASVRTHSV
ncbi:hypothetical protein [Peredibacter starrii]|uniref:Ceramidase n=1 Tax=Peredibacter starrii TaxID=28202 RepID=A0AAX4HKY9_9BACT|nr:hypothetical protein [Peredibacter starrii]WPU63870.1 hypothetical protein SOO65_14340 [Peredibacter starrii]